MPNSFVVCDKNVVDFALSLYPDYPIYQLIADESHKTIDTVMDICRWLLENGADRKSVLYAVGGGVTSDLVGFTAGIYKRGISYINVPTTLLSQVDAGIGGKTGCNLDSYKNMIGLTHFPEETIIYPEVLKTLPRRELRSGAAELLKTFIIKDEGNYEKAVEVLQKGKELDYKALGVLVKAAGAVKREIVEIDPYEKNLRRVLNLGHSFAHAIEWKQQKTCGNYSHGEAVAMGIIEAAQLSAKRGLCTRNLVDKLRADFRSCDLPTELPFEKKDLIPALLKDKKTENGKIHFIFIEEIGKVRIEQISTNEIPLNYL